MQRRAFLTGATALALWPQAATASESIERRLVLARRGTLPILLTASHGGQASIPGVRERDITGKGKDAWKYVTTRDNNTDKLAEGIATEIRALSGKDAYLVVARFDRKYLDANRTAEIAYDQPAARPIYDHYHGMIREYVDEIRTRHAAGLLVDVHGQVKFPDSLLRGTLNGQSVTRLIRRAGFDAVTGPRGMFGLLETNGFKVFPTNAHPPKDRHEDGGFNGGHTTDHYGSHRDNGIDAIQFEYGSDFRKAPELARTIKRTAKSIVAFYEAYLKT